MSSQTLPDLNKLKESLAQNPTDLELLKKNRKRAKRLTIGRKPLRYLLPTLKY